MKKLLIPVCAVLIYLAGNFGVVEAVQKHFTNLLLDEYLQIASEQQSGAVNIGSAAGVCWDFNGNGYGIVGQGNIESTLYIGDGGCGELPDTIRIDTSSGTAVTIAGGAIILNLPTSDPNTWGQLWNDNGTLKVSQ